jgi:hypothetical protein
MNMRAVLRLAVVWLALFPGAALAASPGAATSPAAPAHRAAYVTPSYLLFHISRKGIELSRVRLTGVPPKTAPDVFPDMFAVAAGGKSIWVRMDTGDLIRLDSSGKEVWRGSGFRTVTRLVANPNDGSCWAGFQGDGDLLHLSANGKEVCRRPDLVGWWPLALDQADGSLWAWSDKGEVIHLTPSGRTLGRASLGGWTNDSASAAVNARDGSLWTVSASPRRIIQLAGDGRVLARKAPLSQEVRVDSVNPRNGSYWGAVYWWTDEEGPHVGALVNTRVVHLTADGREVGTNANLDRPGLHASPFDDSCWAVNYGGWELCHLDAKARTIGKPLPHGVSTLTVDASDGSCWAICTVPAGDLPAPGAGAGQ